MKLNPEQQLAVDHFNGPCLVTSVPGSGKTSALTQRVVNLIKRYNVKPENILCLTFTNKAANEMKERVSKEIGEMSSSIWISTFHSLCVGILRKFGSHIGLSSSFSIYDDKDQVELLRKVTRMKGMEFSDREIRDLVKLVNDLREDIIPIEEKNYTDVEEEVVTGYLKILDEFQACDFSGLQSKTYELFTKFPGIVEKLQNRFQYILIDEGQDTNAIQYELIKLLGIAHKNVFMVADFCQSIFAFRGSKPENLYKFKKEFEGTREITLHRNYRSTKNILKVAQQLIRNNPEGKNVVLTADSKGDGEPVQCNRYNTQEEEAEAVASKLFYLHENKGIKWSDMAVLYRTNAQSKLLEVAIKHRNIPYKIVGGFSFFDRSEVKTTLAYLSLLTNPNDTIAFHKAISNPPRKIGDTTVGKLEVLCKEKGISIIEACKLVDENICSLKKGREELKKFIETYEKYANSKEGLAKIASGFIMDSGYVEHMQNLSLKDDKAYKRMDNIDELMKDIGNFAEENKEATLADYIQNMQLMTSADEKDEDKEKVTLMSCHACKGLEYPIIFIIGAENGVMPHALAEDINEERRIFYTACTRAKSLLVISYSENKKKFNFQEKRQRNIKCFRSIFLTEMLGDYTNVPEEIHNPGCS